MADCGFSKTFRLQRAAEYQAVFGGAQLKVSCRYFLFLAISNGKSKSRLGLVVAKKNIPTAVQRNRIKRQIREAFRSDMELADGLDIVVLVRRDADKLDNRQLSDKLVPLFQDIYSQVSKPINNS